MFYPEDFKKRVKEMFPDWENLHRNLDCGSIYVGQILYADFSIPIDTILAATSLDELQDTAKAIKKRKELYSEWCKLYDEYKSSLNG